MPVTGRHGHIVPRGDSGAIFCSPSSDRRRVAAWRSVDGPGEGEARACSLGPGARIMRSLPRGADASFAEPSRARCYAAPFRGCCSRGRARVRGSRRRTRRPSDPTASSTKSCAAIPVDTIHGLHPDEMVASWGVPALVVAEAEVVAWGGSPSRSRARQLEPMYVRPGARRWGSRRGCSRARGGGA